MDEPMKLTQDEKSDLESSRDETQWYKLHLIRQ